MNKVYFISGLGADKRVFSFLNLSFCEPVFVEWITPNKNESLRNYAIRLRNQIPDPNPIIIGISFGGMLATEIAKENSAIKVIIISSNKTKREFPLLARLGKYFPVYKWLPNPIFKKTTILFKSILGAKGKEKRKLLRQILLDSDPKFLKWAIHSILHWENKTIPENLIHIHGTKDQLLPYRLVAADYTIQKGKHLMIMDDHEEISVLLKELIS